MVPGLSEADCRAAELRFRELRAEAAQRHLVGHEPVARRERAAATGDLGARVAEFLARSVRRRQGAQPAEAAGPAVAVPAALGAGE